MLSNDAFHALWLCEPWRNRGNTWRSQTLFDRKAGQTQEVQMSRFEDHREAEKIMDNFGNFREASGGGFVATFVVVALIGFVAWGIGFVQVQSYSWSTSVTHSTTAPPPTTTPLRQTTTPHLHTFPPPGG